jgi:serine/threonine protein phosphatase PrpC
VYMDAECNYPGIAMSRSLGDTELDSYGVIPDPDITTYTLDDQDKFLILASDGVWEFIDDNTVVAMVEHWLGVHAGDPRAAEHAAREVAREAMQIWALEEEGGYRDDISITVVQLPCFEVDIARAASAAPSKKK